MSDRWVVVTTDKDRRGVFFGKLVKQESESTCVLADAQMAVYWSIKTHGVLGLAANGPADGSKITPSVPRIELNGVTAVMDATDAAREAWQKRPWG